MVRGGAFNNNARNVRAANRNRNDPDNRNDNIGFRVVVSRSSTPASPAGRTSCGPRRGTAESVPGRVRHGPDRANTNGPASCLTVAGAGRLFSSRTVFETLCSWENLTRAYRKASKGKRGLATVAAFEHRLEDHLWTLHEELTTGRYRPRGYTSFYIHEPKRRLISAAAFRDRVVHHALCNVIEPIFEATFNPDSYANRTGKGTHRALDRVQQLARRFAFVLQCDVRQFFPSLDHEILRHRIATRVTDARTLDLVDLILASGAGVLDEAYDMVFFSGDDLFAALRPRGLPIGNLTSQFWANVDMDPFDRFVTRELGCRGYVRYVDDFLLFANDKATLWSWRAGVVERLARLRLTMHPGAHPRPVTEGIPFLGFTVFPERRRLKRRKGVHFARRLRRLVADCNAGRESVGDVLRSVQGWVNHARYGNTVGLRKRVLRNVVVRPPAEPLRCRASALIACASRR